MSIEKPDNSPARLPEPKLADKGTMTSPRLTCLRNLLQGKESYSVLSHQLFMKVNQEHNLNFRNLKKAHKNG